MTILERKLSEDESELLQWTIEDFKRWLNKRKLPQPVPLPVAIRPRNGVHDTSHARVGKDPNYGFLPNAVLAWLRDHGQTNLKEIAKGLDREQSGIQHAVERLVKGGALERIQMGQRRFAYRLKGGA